MYSWSGSGVGRSADGGENTAVFYRIFRHSDCLCWQQPGVADCGKSTGSRLGFRDTAIHLFGVRVFFLFDASALRVPALLKRGKGLEEDTAV